MCREVGMGVGKWGSFKSIEYRKATVGLVKLRKWLKKKRGIKSLWFIYSFYPTNFQKGFEIGELGCLSLQGISAGKRNENRH